MFCESHSQRCLASVLRRSDFSIMQCRYGQAWRFRGEVWWSDCKKQGMQMVCKMKLRCLLFKCSGQVMHLHSDAIIFHASMFSMCLIRPSAFELLYHFWSSELLSRKLQLEGRMCCSLPKKFSNNTTSSTNPGEHQGTSRNVSSFRWGSLSLSATKH